MPQAKLFYIPNIQQLSYNGRDIIEVENNPMNRFDTVIYKGNSNTIDFQLRDKDRKPINLNDKTLTIFVTNTETDKLQTKKTLEIINETTGFARVTFTEDELRNWPPAFYKYAVTISEDNGREGFAFVDQVFRTTGTFELLDEAIPNPDSTLTITTFNDQSFFFENDSFVGGPVQASETTLHSFLWYLTNFLGSIRVEGTLSNSPPTDDNNAWTTVASKDFDTASSGLAPFTVKGNFCFFRFVYEPNEFNEGTVDKVLYR